MTIDEHVKALAAKTWVVNFGELESVILDGLLEVARDQRHACAEKILSHTPTAVHGLQDEFAQVAMNAEIK